MRNENHVAQARRFHDKLDGLQFEQSLDEARFLVVDQEPQRFDSQINRGMLGLQLGHILNRTVVFRLPSDPRYVNCYDPFGSFSYDDIKAYPMQQASFEIEQYDKVVHFDYQTFWDNHRLRRWFYPYVPPEFSSLNCGRLIFDGEILSRFRLRDEFCQDVKEAKSRIGFDRPIVGLYIGHDGTEPGSSADMLPRLVGSVEAICNESGVDRVFITGDSDDLFDELPQDGGIKYVFDDYAESSSYAHHVLPEEHTELCQEATVAAVTTFELLSACDWVVGPDTVHFARLAAARIGSRTYRCDRHRLISDQPQRGRFRIRLGRS